MDQLIHILNHLSSECPQRCFFNPPSSAREIQLFERSINVKLPEEMLAFYRNFNGGLISNCILKKELCSFESLRWNGYYFLSLSEILDTIANKTEFSARLVIGMTSDRGIKIIPFLHTPIQEWFILRVDNFPQTPVYVTDHEYSSSLWEIVFPSFKELINTYIHMEGQVFYM